MHRTLNPHKDPYLLYLQNFYLPLFTPPSHEPRPQHVPDFTPHDNGDLHTTFRYAILNSPASNNWLKYNKRKCLRLCLNFKHQYLSKTANQPAQKLNLMNLSGKKKKKKKKDYEYFIHGQHCCTGASLVAYSLNLFLRAHVKRAGEQAASRYEAVSCGLSAFLCLFH